MATENTLEQCASSLCLQCACSLSTWEPMHPGLGDHTTRHYFFVPYERKVAACLSLLFPLTCNDLLLTSISHLKEALFFRETWYYLPLKQQFQLPGEFIPPILIKAMGQVRLPGSLLKAWSSSSPLSSMAHHEMGMCCSSHSRLR